MNNFNMNKGVAGIPVTSTISTPSHPIPSNIIQTRELLYRLIISQLFYDGYQQVAVTLSNMGKTFFMFNLTKFYI